MEHALEDLRLNFLLISVNEQVLDVMKFYKFICRLSNNQKTRVKNKFCIIYYILTQYPTMFFLNIMSYLNQIKASLRLFSNKRDIKFDGVIIQDTFLSESYDDYYVFKEN